MIVVKRKYVEDIEKALDEGKKPVELLNVILGFLNFKSMEFTKNLVNHKTN